MGQPRLERSPGLTRLEGSGVGVQRLEAAGQELGAVDFHVGSLGRSGHPYVPRGADIVIRTGSGQVWLNDLDGTTERIVAVSTGSGDVEVSATGRPTAEVTTGSGDVEIDGEDHRDGIFEGASPGVLRVLTGSGDVEINRTRPG
ncbi:MAG: DUF4097 family beta strand repeat-containing protein [Acidimicrobiales bacterium]